MTWWRVKTLIYLHDLWLKWVHNSWIIIRNRFILITRMLLFQQIFMEALQPKMVRESQLHLIVDQKWVISANILTAKLNYHSLQIIEDQIFIRRGMNSCLLYFPFFKVQSSTRSLAIEQAWSVMKRHLIHSRQTRFHQSIVGME